MSKTRSRPAATAALAHESSPVRFAYLATPIGRWLVAATPEAVIAVDHLAPGEPPSPSARPRSGWAEVRRVDAAGVLGEALAQLEAWFRGERTDFDLPLGFAGTPFQREVWAALCRIPFGATASYADIAREVGRPGAARAVGMANHRNPIAIVVPCHRVIGADGSLVGYGGGLDLKAALLEHERGVLARRVGAATAIEAA